MCMFQDERSIDGPKSLDSKPEPKPTTLKPEPQDLNPKSPNTKPQAEPEDSAVKGKRPNITKQQTGLRSS